MHENKIGMFKIWRHEITTQEKPGSMASSLLFLK